MGHRAESPGARYLGMTETVIVALLGVLGTVCVALIGAVASGRHSRHDADSQGVGQRFRRRSPTRL